MSGCYDLGRRDVEKAISSGKARNAVQGVMDYEKVKEQFSFRTHKDASQIFEILESNEQARQTVCQYEDNQGRNA